MPFLGKTPAQIVDPEVDIDGGSIDGATIGATSASAATVTTFTSTGIDDNSTSTAITIDASENVGIGVTDPQRNLVVAATSGPILQLADDVSGTTSGNGLEIQQIGANSFFNNREAGTMRFLVDSDEKARIDVNGRVGIGTNNPSPKFHVIDNNSGGARIDGGSVTSGESAYLWFQNGRARFGYDGSRGAVAISDYNQNGSTTGKVICFDTGGSERARITDTGNLLVGQPSPHSNAQANVHASGGIAALGFCTRAGSSGAFTSNRFNIQWPGPNLWIDSTNVGTISVSSDYRIKRNIETQTENAIDRVKLLRPVTYQMADFEPLFIKSDDIKEGFIAHELADVIPSAVEGEKDAIDQIQSLKLDALCSVLTKAIQEQQAIIDSQASAIADLTTRLEALEAN